MTRKVWILSLAGGMLASFGLATVNPAVKAGQQPAPVTKESSTAFRAVVKRTLPAVVSIVPKVTNVPVVKRNLDPNDPNDQQDLLKEFMEQFGNGRGGQQPSGGMGSGVIVTANGTVLTNNHVVGNAQAVEVKLQDGRTFTSKQIVKDPKTDLAVIKLDLKDGYNLPFAEFGDSSQLDIGDWVLAMGSPFGLSGTVTAGIISSKGRPLGANMYEDFLQTDAAVNPGNSGGPLVDLDGKVIGINTAIRSGTGTFAGVAFAIPSNMARDVVDQIVKNGKVRRGYLGISMADLDAAAREKLRIASGVVVGSLPDGDTPARKAGLKENDVIVDVDGHPMNDINMLKNLVSKTPAGQTLHMKVNRDGTSIDVPVTIEEQPEDYGLVDSRRAIRQFRGQQRATVSLEKLGMTVSSNLKGRGVVVTDVTDDGPAAVAGISAGAVIQQVERRPIGSPEQFAKIVGSVNLAEGVLVQVRYPDDTTKLIVIKVEKDK